MKALCRRFFIMLVSCAGLFPALVSATGYQLAINPAGQTVVISWPSAAANYTLQSALSLSAANWLAVSNPVSVNGATNFVTYTNDSSVRFFRLFSNSNAPVYPGMVFIPAGAFTMGDVSDTNINGDAAPVSVTVSAFYMDTNVVSGGLWAAVSSAAVSSGYNFSTNPASKATNHPEQSVDWFDAVKWCNARSQQAGLTPVYYTDAGLTQVYTNDAFFPETTVVYANWAVNGYRLPTEAEWEKAARGGVSGQRFPWGNLISESLANYFGDPPADGGPFYDLGPYYYNPAFENNGTPYTSPVGYFAPNGYGLCDMAGNVLQWCWDWYGTPYAGGADPQGPASGSDKVLRGGDWADAADVACCACRTPSGPTQFITAGTYGFRCVRGH